jgi:hypothetical protein
MDLIVNSKSSVPPKAQIKSFWLHIPVGIFIVAGVCVHWALGAILAAMFIYYEDNEDQYLKDRAWIDTKGTMWGIGGGIVILAILEFAGISLI